MAVTKVELVRGRRSAGKDSMWRRTYSKTWRVRTDNAADDGPKILGAVDPSSGLAVPSIGSTFYSTSTNKDLGAFVQSLDAQEENEDGLSWLVTAQYGPYDASMFGADPVAWPIKVVFTGQMREQIIYYDQAGDAIVNSAGEGYDDPITIDDPRYTMTITRNELCSTFDLSLASDFGGTTNLNAWNGFGAKKCKMGIITTGDPTLDSNNQVYFYVVTYPVEINRDGWARKLLDRGFNALSGGVLSPILIKGQKPDDPPLLDGTGGVLAPGGTPVFREHEVVPSTDWAGLNLDLAIRIGA